MYYNYNTNTELFTTYKIHAWCKCIALSNVYGWIIRNKKNKKRVT